MSFLGEGWTAHVIDDFGYGDHVRIVFVRRVAGQATQVASQMRSAWVVHDHDMAARLDDDQTLLLPRELAIALRDALVEHEPIPPDGVVVELRAALGVERRRVDSILERVRVT